MLYSFFAIGLGAAIGAILRWLLGIALNAYWPSIPPGTIAANLIGAYLIGVAIVFFTNNPHLAPEWRLLIIPGFLGGLTTFSSFSAEVVVLLQQGRTLMAFAEIGIHVAGSLLMTFLGIFSMTALKNM